MSWRYNPDILRTFLVVALSLTSSSQAFAQNFSFDARDIALGSVSATNNLATKTIDERRSYRSIVLPFGLAQILGDLDVYDPGSKSFDPIRAAEYASNPLHYVVGRATATSAQALFVSDVRNATLSRDLSKYRGFVPADDLFAEGLLTPSAGKLFPVFQGPKGSHAAFVGAAPYISLQTDGTVDPRLTGVLSTGVNVPNSQFTITNNDQEQLALAVIAGYRGRFPWRLGGTTSEHDGLFVAINYKSLSGFAYANDDLTVRLNTDSNGLLTDSSNIVINHRYTGENSTGFALDLGVEAVIDRWEVGVGANGVANRIEWRDLKQETYTLQSLTSGNSEFNQSATMAAGDLRVELPVDVRGHVKYYADRWMAAAGAGRGFGGGSFHGGFERRYDRFELRGGVRYAFSKWNPSGGVGFDLSRRVSLDIAAWGTTANIERKRRLAIAASVRLNRSQR